MAPYDLPDVAHDMILRFMGVNFSAIVDGSARIPSSVGDDVKPVLVDSPNDKEAPATVPVGKTPEQDKAMWEGQLHIDNADQNACAHELIFCTAYYNAGSAALVLLLIVLAIGLFLFFRRRRRTARHVDLSTKEESIPLSQNIGDDADNEEVRMDGDYKGKGRLQEETAIFNVGSDDEDGYRDSEHRV